MFLIEETHFDATKGHRMSDPIVYEVDKNRKQTFRRGNGYVLRFRSELVWSSYLYRCTRCLRGDNG